MICETCQQDCIIWQRKKKQFPTMIDSKAQFLYDGQIPTDSVQAINI